MSSLWCHLHWRHENSFSMLGNKKTDFNFSKVRIIDVSFHIFLTFALRSFGFCKTLSKIKHLLNIIPQFNQSVWHTLVFNPPGCYKWLRKFATPSEVEIISLQAGVSWRILCAPFRSFLRLLTLSVAPVSNTPWTVWRLHAPVSINCGNHLQPSFSDTPLGPWGLC